MILLRLRTEFSFRRVFGRVEEVLAAVRGSPAAAITDDGTWGHVAWTKATAKVGIQPILGAEIDVVKDAARRDKQYGRAMAFLARNADGLRELYALVTKANSADHFYYHPRLSAREVNEVSPNLVVLSGPAPLLSDLSPVAPFYLELSPAGGPWLKKAVAQDRWPLVATADNYYPRPEDWTAYAFHCGETLRRTTISFIPTEEELRLALPMAPDEAFTNTESIAALCEAVPLPHANLVAFPNADADVRARCVAGAGARGLQLDGRYGERLERELDLIRQKQFADYFVLLADMVQEAKTRMFVGPARGSAAGSLVCYLMGITDVDPLVHDLMFERFIDVTRADLPDVDLDFPHTHRDQVMAYLVQKYGAERVGRLGTINRHKADSALGETGRFLQIPKVELDELQGAIIKRSTGDARAQFSVTDALDTMEVGKRLKAKYPGLVVAGQLEGHARYGGTHAAGYVVTAQPLVEIVSLDHRGCAQVDKSAAETLNLLKIDVLGLRTLTVLQDALGLIGKPVDWLLHYPLDDAAAFRVLSREKFSGIFQWEGYALQNLTRQMPIESFEDLVSITSLARPGPLHCGAAQEFLDRRNGKAVVVPLHSSIADVTARTFGTVVYQEQVMAIGRRLGQLSWEDVSQLRKAMSKSLGQEFFNHYWEKFRNGALAQGIAEPEALTIWNKLCTHGSWSFNRSHAVSYALISYWCCVLKAHYSLAFAAATLRHPMADERYSIKLLRELAAEGIPFKVVDPERSTANWDVVDGVVLGGLTNIKGIGEKKAAQILAKRASGEPLTPGLVKLLTHPVTPFDDLFEAHRRFGRMYRVPRDYGILSGPLVEIAQIGGNGEYIFLGKLMEKNLRDLNEYGNLVKRAAAQGCTPEAAMLTEGNLFLNLTLEDDSSSIFATMRRRTYATYGQLVTESKVGEWFLWQGYIKDNWRKIHVTKVRKLTTEAPDAGYQPIQGLAGHSQLAVAESAPVAAGVGPAERALPQRAAGVGAAPGAAQSGPRYDRHGDWRVSYLSLPPTEQRELVLY